jgi:type I restriction enzyme R subunit
MAYTRANFIDPALRKADWQPSNTIREHYFIDDRTMAGGVRGRRCVVDYLLHKDNRHLALVKAKQETDPPINGLQQVNNYANKPRSRFYYSSNDKYACHSDLETIEKLSLLFEHQLDDLRKQPQQ